MRRKRILGFVAVAAVVAVIATPTAAMAHRAKVVVNLGDSFASGEGGTETGPYLAGTDTPTNKCHRSNSSAVELLSVVPGWRVANVACSGAVASDVVSTTHFGEAPQASRIPSNAKIVYIMIGGNDIGFGTLVGCFIQTDCELTDVPAAAIAAIGVLGPKLDAAYAAITAAAPHAKKVVMLYPPLMPADGTADRSRCPELSEGEVGAGNKIQVGLNNVVRQRAQAHGFKVVDAANLFAGHSLCDRVPYFYRPGTVPLEATYHPTLGGRVAGAIALAAKV